MLKEKIVLVFENGTKFKWNTRSIRDSVKVVKLQKKLGDPVKIIGDGKIAKMLKEKYEVYSKDPKAYKMDVFGTASKLGKIGKDELEKKLRKVSRKLGVKT